MTSELVCPEQIDHHLNWPLGTAARMARRRRLPHYVLPDGAIRLRWTEIEALVRRIPTQQQADHACLGLYRSAASPIPKQDEIAPRLPVEVDLVPAYLLQAEADQATCRLPLYCAPNRT